MLDNLSWGHLLVLGLAALFVLGPQRLPEAAAWLARTLTQAREFAGDTRARLHHEIGPELDQLRQPLEQLREPLQQLRELDPLHAITLLDHNATHPPAPTAPAIPPLTPGEHPPIDPDAT